MFKHFRVFALPILLVSSCISSVYAGAIDAVYAFGDSLSDAGNIYAATGGTIPGAPYSQGRFTNGPVWVQDLSASLGLGQVSASLTGGTDFAYGDASSGTTPVHAGTSIDLTGPGGQLAQFHLANPIADPNALYTIWIGSNDLDDILTGASPANYATDAGAVVANIDSAINTLAGYGAKNVLVLTVPDLGKTPDAIATGPLGVAAASTLSAEFDLALVNGSPSAGLPSLSALAATDGLNLSVLDTYSLVDGLTANPGAYGFTNVTDSCLSGGNGYYGGETVCANPNQYLFWDGLHPTAAADALVADATLSVITPTPEPASMALMGAGLLGVCLLGWKRVRE